MTFKRLVLLLDLLFCGLFLAELALFLFAVYRHAGAETAPTKIATVEGADGPMVLFVSFQVIPHAGGLVLLACLAILNYLAFRKRPSSSGTGGSR